LDSLSANPETRCGCIFESATVPGFALKRLDQWLSATDSRTSRQKVQRAFAAQLLCPIEHLDEFLSGDYTQERIEDAAEHFGISPLAISSQLASGKRRPVHKQPQAQPGCSDYDFKNSLNFLASAGIFYRAGQPVTNRIVRIGQAGHGKLRTVKSSNPSSNSVPIRQIYRRFSRAESLIFQTGG
jgi:hypothetical protein